MKILITSFERYGLYRRNISKTVAEILEDKFRQLKNEDANIDFLTLPVSKEGIEGLKAYVKYEYPKIIFCLGQMLGKGFRIESTAYPKTKDGVILKNQKKSSDLARYLAMKTGTLLTDKIGNAECNDAYYTALSLTENSLFCHIGAFEKNPEDIADKLFELISKGIEAVEKRPLEAMERIRAFKSQQMKGGNTDNE